MDIFTVKYLIYYFSFFKNCNLVKKLELFIQVFQQTHIFIIINFDKVSFLGKIQLT